MVAGGEVGRAAAAILAGVLLAAGGARSATPTRAVLVLFHGCHDGASSRDWQPLLGALPPSAKAIAVDLPGHGSAGGAKIEADGDNTAWMAAWRARGTTVVDEAFARARKEAPGAFVVAVGAGCGGFFALMGAERQDVGAVVTLSGLSDERQRERLTSRQTPVLGMASRDDRDVPARVEAIVESGGPGSALKLYPGAAHGTAILAGAPGSVGDIARWVEERALKPAGGGPGSGRPPTPSPPSR